jgi:hypothetical protein
MNLLETAQSCSEIPVCRGAEVLSILIESDPISGEEAEEYGTFTRKIIRSELKNFAETFSSTLEARIVSGFCATICYTTQS